MNELLSNLGQHFLFHTYVLNSGLPKTKHYDSSEVMISAIFGMLVDHVEVYSSFAYRLREYDSGASTIKPKYRWWKPYRDANAGVMALTLQQQEVYDESYAVLKGDPKYEEPTCFAKIAADQLALYFWWTTKRTTRPNPFQETPPWYEFINYTEGKHDLEILTEDFIPQTSFEENQRMVIQKFYHEEDARYIRKLMELSHTLMY